MNTTVTFPIAKLLKEKGFNLKVITFYDYERLSTPFDEQRQVDGLINYNPINWNSVKNHYTSAPTIADVVMWLYEKHGIWIISVPEGLSTTWAFSLFNIDPEKGRIIFNSPSFDSPTEAYEAGIEHILNNLI